jgi:hypothetical protein
MPVSTQLPENHYHGLSWKIKIVKHKGVELKQGFKLNDTTNRLINDKQLFLMPMADNKFVKVVNVGDPEMKQTADMVSNQDQTYEYKYVFRMGVAIQIGLLFGVWNIAA